VKSRFSFGAVIAALAVSALSFGAQLGLRHVLGEKTLLSPDAVVAISFGAEAAGFLLAGFVASFFGGGLRSREQLLAALLLVGVGFGLLYVVKPPSFSYDRFYADKTEMILWALLASASAFLLGLWGASAGLLIGAGKSPDFAFAYEVGVARTHLRLNLRAGLMLAWIGLALPGALFGAGILTDWRAGARDLTLWHKAGAVLGIAAFVLLIAYWIRARILQARLLPGQAKRRPATLVLTFISIAGVVVGVWALTIVLSVMSGFEGDLKQKIIGTNAHGMLLKFTDDFSEWKSVLPTVRAVPDVVGATPFILNEVIIANSKGNPSGAELKGIDSASVGSVSDLPKQVIAGDLAWIDTPQNIPVATAVAPNASASQQLQGEDYQEYLDSTFARRRDHPEEGSAAKVDPATLTKMPGICVGKEMSHGLRIWVGDVINVITPMGEMGPTGPLPRSRAFRVACILYSGMYEYDSKFAYISIPEAQSFFRMKDNIVGLEMKFRDVDQARGMGRKVVAALKGFPYRSKDWADLNRNLFSALKLEKLAMAIILTFIVLVACFTILATLIMLVLEKTKEISILKSMGARDASIMKIFVLEGVTIGAIGTLIGCLMGLASCSFVARFGLRLDPDVYYISYLPVTVDLGQFALVAVISICLAYLATLYPAITASRLSPVDGLREE